VCQSAAAAAAVLLLLLLLLPQLLRCAADHAPWYINTA
jgi:hypothetical protein